MESFKQYMRDNTDVEKSLAKLPKAFRKLVDGFHIKLVDGHTLPGDKDHVGVITTEPKRQIKIACPWNYPREFALFHEVGHLAFEKYVRGTKWEEEWKLTCKKNLHRKKQEPDEENWCHAFSNHFVKNKVVLHTHPEWEKYFKRFMKEIG